MRTEGLRRVVYKPIPWIYHKQPSEEDLYAIVEVCGASLTRGLSSAISSERQNKWYRIRECGARHAKQTGITIEETENYLPFWQILTANLRERYGLNPVHSLEEIEMLHHRLPENIRLVIAKEEDDVIGGGYCMFLTVWCTLSILRLAHVASNCMLLTISLRWLLQIHYGRMPISTLVFLQKSMVHILMNN